MYKKNRIEIFLDEVDDLFERYYQLDDIHLNSDLEQYIFSKIRGDIQDYEILFFSDSNIDIYPLKKAVTSTFTDRLKSNQHIYRRNKIKAIILVGIGTVIVLIYLGMLESHTYFAGILSIIFEVFLWAGTEIYFFDNREIKNKIRKYKCILNADLKIERTDIGNRNGCELTFQKAD